MPSLVDLPWLGAAIKLFLAALFAPVWWPVLVEVRAEILRSAKTDHERRREPKPAGQGFVAQLHGERLQGERPHVAPPRGARARGASRAPRARRQFRAAR